MYDTTKEFLGSSESLLQQALGNLWDGSKDDCKDWLETLAALHLRILKEGETEHTALTRKYVDMGQKALVRTLKARAERASSEFLGDLWSLLKDLLKVLVAVAVQSAIKEYNERTTK